MPRLVAVVSGLLLALLLGEAALRLADPVATQRLPLRYNLEALEQLAAGQAYVAFDAQLGWITTPNADRMGGDVRYRHNAAGLRAEREYNPQPPPGVRRIAAFGDSFTYCEEVQIDDCWTERLAEMLPRSEVLNYGVPGGAPDQAWLRYQGEGAAMRPCAVLIGHMVENINRVVNRFRPFYYPETGIPLAKPRFVLEGGRPILLPNPAEDPEDLKDSRWVEASLGPRDAWYFPGTFVANPLDDLRLVSLARTVTYQQRRRGGVEWDAGWAEQQYRPGSEGFEVLTAVLAGFADQVRADGATPVVLVFPSRGEIIARRDEAPKVHAALLAALRQRGLPTIDLTDELGEQARRSSLGNITVEHYRPLGNTVVARTLARELPRMMRDTCGR